MSDSDIAGDKSGGAPAIDRAIARVAASFLGAVADGGDPDLVLCRDLHSYLGADRTALVEVGTRARTLRKWPINADVRPVLEVLDRNRHQLLVRGAQVLAEAVPANGGSWHRDAPPARVIYLFTATPPSMQLLALLTPAAADTHLGALSRWQALLISARSYAHQLSTGVDSPGRVDTGLGLTSREHEVLNLLAEGHLATAIASQLGVSTRTVHTHLAHIYSKLGAHDRLVAVRLGLALGLIGSSSLRRPCSRHDGPLRDLVESRELAGDPSLQGRSGSAS